MVHAAHSSIFLVQSNDIAGGLHHSKILFCLACIILSLKNFLFLNLLWLVQQKLLLIKIVYFLSIPRKHPSEVILGFGGRQMVFYSIRENVDLEKWNHIFVIYRFREGWCDLVVNGVLSNRLQFGRFQKIKWPRHQIFIGKDADNCNSPSSLEASNALFIPLASLPLFSNGFLGEERKIRSNCCCNR